MTKAQACYNLLLMLSVLDGKLTEEEQGAIKTFVNRRYDEQVDFEQENNNLVNTDSENLLQKFQDAAVAFGENSTQDEQRELVSTALDIVMDDGQMSDEESSIFHALASVWQIEIQDLVSAHQN